jgi:two-component system sensor histidine kinase PilS (NtrC family)
MGFIQSPLQFAPSLSALPHEPSDSYLRSLYFFNGYRLIVALLMLGATAVFGNSLAFGSMNFELFVYVSAAYVTFSVLCFLLIAARRYFHLQLGLQVGADILFIVVLMFASDGISSGLGLLLLSGLAAAGLITRGRLTLFYAALASIAVLLEHTVQVLFYSGQTTQYVQAGLLSIGYFTTAWVAHTLAKYLVATEQLAAQREIDLASMAEVSQLVIQDMHDGVLVVDEHGLIRQYNTRAEKMLGPLRQQLSLKQYSPLLERRLEEWRESDCRFDPMITVLLNNKVSARFFPVGQPECRRSGFSRGPDAGAAAGAADKLALGRLTPHRAEIRNPLSAISHATELLRRSRRSPKPYHGCSPSFTTTAGA